MTTDTLRIAGIVRESIVDGEGLRFVIFGQGCPHRCPGCHNPQTHDFSGGEPFCQAEAFARLARQIRTLPGKLDLTVYSGYTFEELLEKAKTEPGTAALLKEADFLIDGPYHSEERDLSLLFRGSRNQRYLDLKLSLARSIPIPAPEHSLSARFRYSHRTA